MVVAKKLQDLIGINPNALILCYYANCLINGWSTRSLIERYPCSQKKLTEACEDKEVWDLYIEAIRPYVLDLEKLPKVYR